MDGLMDGCREAGKDGRESGGGDGHIDSTGEFFATQLGSYTKKCENCCKSYLFHVHCIVSF